MGRRKKFMDDGEDSSDEDDGRINFDMTEEDMDGEMNGFAGFRQRRHVKRNRFGDDDDDDDEQPRGGLGSAFQASASPAPQFTPAETTYSPKDPAKDKVRQTRPVSATPPSDKPTAGFAQFNAHGTGFGQKMLEKMGWKLGRGLGASGEGIVNPVETKKRPTGMGIGFRGFDERTEQAKRAAKQQAGSSDESEDDSTKEAVVKRGAWKRDGRGPRRPKTVYKTAADIMADTAIPGVAMPTQKVIDMTGPGVREISLADIRPSDSPSLLETTTRLPELRHNLRLIVDLAKHQLENLSQEKQTGVHRVKALEQELALAQERRSEDSVKLERVQEMKTLAKRLEQKSKTARSTGAFEAGDVSALYGEEFEQLQTHYADEVKAFGLDALVVVVWEPVLKQKALTWDVLAEPTWGVEEVKRWRALLRTNDDIDAENGYRRGRRKAPAGSVIATPYETMMNTVWLSKIRSAINNTWDVHDPDPLIQLLEAWAPPVLPRFIFENIINQLILPKIHRAVDAWDPRNDETMIHAWIHPWLPILQPWRLADVFTDIRHKLSVVLRHWHPSDESAVHIIKPWKNVWTAAQTESFLTRCILPKLTLTLQKEFEVNPRNQVMEPLVWCLAWQDILSQTVIAQLLENEFFPKWLGALRTWLSLGQDRVNNDEVIAWYKWWTRDILGSYGLMKNEVILSCTKKALELMHMAATQ